MSAAERVYRLLLRAYPPRFRAEYGREMTLVFRDRRREAGRASARFWLEVLDDVARSAPALHVESWRAALGADHPTTGGAMRPMAIVAVLAGAYVMQHALRGGWDGGVVHGEREAFVAAALGVVAGALLVAGAIALLRRGTVASSFARRAAVASLVLCAVVALAIPFWSVFARLVAVVVPLALLLVLRGGSRTPRAA